jgi:Tripartite tricarboxylate transporter TctB family
MIRVRSPRDLCAGALFCVIAAVAIWQSAGLEYGSLRSMGTGFFPHWLAILLFALGAFIGLRGIVIDGPRLEGVSSKLALPTLLSVAVFGLAISQAGLLLSVALCVAVASLAGSGYRRVEVLLLAICMAAFSALLFKYALNLQMELLPAVLRN